MIEIPVHNQSGEQVDTLQVDEEVLGGQVKPGLLKQAYVRYHANKRLGVARTKNRGETAYSTRKLYRQKGTGNARRGSAGTNILRGGGMAFAKRQRSFRQDMPEKMRRLANRNAMLAKAVDGEIKIVDTLDFGTPSTKKFQTILSSLSIDRSCLVALASTTGNEARSASNLDDVSLIRMDQVNVLDLLNHRYLLADKATFEAWLATATAQAATKKEAK